MKKLFITASLVLAFGMNSYAQNDIKDENELTYSCDEMVKQNLEKGTITLVGNANLKTSVFEFLNAETIVINKITKEIIVTGEFKINMNGGTIRREPELKKHHLRYKIGENVAYVE
jgi:lipopolysaccharide assembly outer membrane protein LptD (OstA)